MSEAKDLLQIYLPASDPLTGVLIDRLNFLLQRISDRLDFLSENSHTHDETYVTGPATATDSNFAAFDTTTGKLVKDSSYKASSFATSGHSHATYVVGPSSVTDGTAVAFDGTTGKLVKADSRLAANLVAGPSSATDTAIARYNGTGGKTIQDSGATIAADGTIKTGSTNYTQFDSTGHQTMAGTAKPWRDELADAVSLQQSGPGVSRNTSEVTVDFTTAANLSDFVYLNIQLNHDKDLTVSIYPHIHWFQAETNVPNWLIQYRWQTNAGAKVTSWTNLACNTVAHTWSSGTIHQICHSTAIAVPAGTALSDIVQFKIIRDNANASTVFGGADPYTATVGMLAFDVHFQLNSLGSTDEYTK